MENRIHGEIGCRHNLENDLVVMMTTSVIIHESKLQISHAHKCIGNIKKQKKSSPWREFSFSTDNRMHVLGECLSETTFCRTWLPQWYQDLPSYSFQFLLLCAVKHFPQWNVFLPHVRSKKNGSLPLGSKSNCKKMIITSQRMKTTGKVDRRENQFHT